MRENFYLFAQKLISNWFKSILGITFLSAIGIIFADSAFDELISSGKYNEAIEYAEEKIPPSNRDESVWIKMASACDTLGLSEKALACYLVTWRLNSKSYAALLGIAKIYNKLNQPENAITWAQKTLDVNFTAEAAWEYAKSCISLNRANEAKAALEKVIQTDPLNNVANRELGKIYLVEKKWQLALPLLKKSNEKKMDSQVMYQIGKASLEAGIMDSAVNYLLKSIEKGGPEDAALDLARAYFGMKKYDYALTMYLKIPAEKLVAEDLYKKAFAKEVSTGADCWKEYEAAVDEFRQSSSIEALKAREKVGVHYLKEKKFTDAISHFRFILNIDHLGKSIPDIYVLLSEALKGNGNTEEAVTLLEKAISLDNKNIEAYVHLGELYSFLKMPQKAKNIWENLIQLSPGDHSIYLKLGTYYLKENKFADAIMSFEKSLSIKNSAEAQAGIAMASFRMGNGEMAVNAAKHALEIDTSNSDAHLVLANIHFNKGEYESAVKHLEFIDKFEPSNLEYLEKLVVCYKNMGHITKMYDVDNRIVTLSSKNIDSRMRLAKRADSLNLVEPAMNLYSQLAVLIPSESYVFKRLFKLSIVNGTRNDITTYFGKYVSLKPDDGEAFGDYGDYLYQLKDFNTALDAYRKAFAINPSLKGYHKRYAEIVISKGLEDEVITALNNVIKNGDAELGTYTTLGMIYHKKNKYSKAIEMYQSALQMEHVNIEVLTLLAESQYLNSDYNGAVISYEQVIMLNSKAVKEFKALGDLYIKLNRGKEAVGAYTKYFEKDSADLEIAKFLGEDAYEKKEYANAVIYLRTLGLQADTKYLVMYSEALVNVKKYDIAVVPLEKLRLNKKNITMDQITKILHLLALSYENLGKLKDASSIYEEYLSLSNVKDLDAAYKRAYLLESIDTLGAVRIYESNMTNYPADYRNFLRAGLLLAGRVDALEKSIRYLKRVTELASSVPEVWLEVARVYSKLNRYNEELDAYKKFAEKNPQNIEANSRIGTLLMQNGKINEGMVYLELANSLKADDPEIMAALATGYMRTNRETEAIELMEKAKKQKPGDPVIRLHLFELYKSVKKNDKALDEIKGLVEIKREPEYLVKYAEFLSNNGKQKEALELLEEMLANGDDNLDVLMLKAKFLRKDKKFDEALEIYKEISEISPDYIQSMFERAETHREQSKLQWAETFYNRVLRIDPQFALAELGLAKVAKLRNDSVGYQMHLEKARGLDPHNTLILEELSSQSKK